MSLYRDTKWLYSARLRNITGQMPSYVEDFQERVLFLEENVCFFCLRNLLPYNFSLRNQLPATHSQ